MLFDFLVSSEGCGSNPSWRHVDNSTLVSCALAICVPPPWRSRRLLVFVVLTAEVTSGTEGPIAIFCGCVWWRLFTARLEDPQRHPRNIFPGPLNPLPMEISARMLGAVRMANCYRTNFAQTPAEKFPPVPNDLSDREAEDFLIRHQPRPQSVELIPV
jgi:hypothetical protein